MSKLVVLSTPVTGHFEFLLSILTRFERAQARLSVDVIGHVLPRRPAKHRCFGGNEPPGPPPLNNDEHTEVVRTAKIPVPNFIPPCGRPTVPTASVAANAALPKISAESNASHFNLHSIKDKNVCVEIKKAIRREQCRTNQARYRSKQHNQLNQLQRHVHRPREDLHGLRLKRQRMSFTEKTNCNPWAIANEAFHLIEPSFHWPWCITSANEMTKDGETQQSRAVLQKSFTHDVSMGSLSGMDALLDQLRRYSLYFGEPQIQLKRVESTVPGVLTASARLSVIVSEFTLRCVFPHLEKAASSLDDDEYRSVREKLLGQRLNCSCELTFLMDEASGRVERLETNINLVESLLELLKSVECVADMPEQTLITSECLVGDLVIGSEESK